MVQLRSWYSLWFKSPGCPGKQELYFFSGILELNMSTTATHCTCLLLLCAFRHGLPLSFAVCSWLSLYIMAPQETKTCSNHMLCTFEAFRVCLSPPLILRSQSLQDFSDKRGSGLTGKAYQPMRAVRKLDGIAADLSV